SRDAACVCSDAGGVLALRWLLAAGALSGCALLAKEQGISVLPLCMALRVRTLARTTSGTLRSPQRQHNVRKQRVQIHGSPTNPASGLPGEYPAIGGGCRSELTVESRGFDPRSISSRP
ncbi:hypothetical protein IscW_ISCW021798, partial [Ixodes scapularis]